MASDLPIESVLPELLSALSKRGRAVLQAPPGAGKTTRVPLALLQGNLCSGRIIMLEPRRLAARAAAERMARTLDEPVGQTVGYRIRGQSAVSGGTRIEVVTEGILTRMLQSEPDLPGVGAVIFDEFHERSLNADLGLALCLEVADALRDDLALLVMSATLDAEPVAELMNAPVITSEGRSFPVASHWLQRPVGKNVRFEAAVANLVLHGLTDAPGDALVFLPGEGEIRRVQSLLQRDVPDDVAIHPLFGAMDFKAQRATIAPAQHGRKVVLATSIAETSLTLEGIGIVVDAGLSRRSEFDPSSGMARLITARVSQAEAAQRAGRAGRVREGRCYKLWTKGEDGSLPAFPPAEIEASDLTGFALEIALWGGKVGEMRFVSPPHAGRLAEARIVLKMLGALDNDGRITDHGKALAALPLHPRLAHMVVKGGPTAPLLAAILSERDLLRGHHVDLNLRLDTVRKHNETDFKGKVANSQTVRRIKDEANRLRRLCGGYGPNDPAVLAALAYPDRIGMRRKGAAPRYLLSGGKGAILPEGDPLASERFLVVTDLDGNPREAAIRQAVAFSRQELEATYEDQILEKKVAYWSRRESRVHARLQTCFGALVLEDRIWNDAPESDISKAMIEGIRFLGLDPDPKAKRLIDRSILMRRYDPDFPDLNEDTLLETAEEWLSPFLSGIRTSGEWKSFALSPALEALIGWDNLTRLNNAVPAHFITPLGRKIPIDYDGKQPKVALRLQEVFGVSEHPTSAGTPIQITLLSPAQRPVQVTEDLPGFWASSYADVRKDMRGRYPKHPWPEDPTQADPTLRAKSRR